MRRETAAGQAMPGRLYFFGYPYWVVDLSLCSAGIAVERSIARDVLRELSAGKVKGKKVKVRLMGEWH
jgi:ATP-dependent RNA helicase DbpA